MTDFTKKLVDVVYPLGNGSKWDNNEIRYSIRSLQEHIFQVRDVYIIGELPDFLQNVKHIPFVDEHQFKETRIALKVLEVCNTSLISEDFLFMNDDHFLLADYGPFEFPYFHKESISATAQARRFQDSYRKSLLNTYMALTKNGHLTHNYDVHCPIVYNKARFSQMFELYDWEVNYGYVVKSMYCNTFKVEGIKTDDFKLNSPMSVSQLQAINNTREFFSIGDKGINEDLKTYLEILFPEKSQYEK